MLLESVAYARPDTVAEALEALASSDGAAALAGGQSLVNVLKHRVASIECSSTSAGWRNCAESSRVRRRARESARA